MEHTEPELLHPSSDIPPKEPSQTEDTFCQASIKPEYLGNEELKQEREKPSEHAAVPQSKRARKRARNEEKAEKVCNAVLRVNSSLSFNFFLGWPLHFPKL